MPDYSAVSTTTPTARQAQDVYRASVAAGAPLTGAALGARFDRSATWGQAQTAAARTDTGSPDARELAADTAVQARAAYLASVEDGTPLTGTELGRRFGRGMDWGCRQVAAARPQVAGRLAELDRERRRPQADPEQLADLYTRYGPWLCRRLAARVDRRDRDWVEDLAQETWIRAWQSLHTFRWDDGGERGFGSWLLALSRNVLAEHYTDRCGRRVRVEVSTEELTRSDPPPELHPPAPAVLPAAVCAALDRLPELTRTVIELNVADGMTQRAAAEHLDGSTQLIARRRLAGLTALRAHAVAA